MACTGRCFHFPSTEDRSPRPTTKKPIEAPVNPSNIYRPLQQTWQTRILALHPWQSDCEGEEQYRYGLSADLFVVTLHPRGSATVEGSDKPIHYVALSYRWPSKGHPDNLAVKMIVNGTPWPITHHLALILESLRQPTETSYLWVDALCINQQDEQEKSQQVSYMLQTYQRAESVIAWLGRDDKDNTLAFSCINNARALRTALQPQESPERHHEDCWIQLQAIYTSLTRLYDSGWLCRTWIRQEIYGAGEIIVQSGSQRASWLDFLHAAFLMPRIRTMLSEHGVDHHDDDNASRINRLVTEAQRNTDALGRSTKAPRNLVEVLMQSADYRVTDEKDTFYAVLGMCDVNADIKENSSSKGAGVVVDYKKPLAEVYKDASAYILGRKFRPNSPYVQPNMAELWHSYKPSKWHHDGLPSWAVDWRSGVMDYEYRLALYKGSFRMVSDDLRSFRVEPCDQRWIWMPLNDPVAFDSAKATGGQQSQESSDVVTVEGNILRLKARAINYVAHLTDYTVPVESFLLRQPMWMGWAGYTIHASSDPGRIRGLFRKPSEDLLNFDPSKHSWRIGLLGVGNDAQVCLVPSSAGKGDLVIAIAQMSFQ